MPVTSAAPESLAARLFDHLMNVNTISCPSGYHGDRDLQSKGGILIPGDTFCSLGIPCRAAGTHRYDSHKSAIRPFAITPDPASTISNKIKTLKFVRKLVAASQSAPMP